MHIVTVCAGNICRSPMAEYLIRHEAGQRHLTDITVSSAGTLRLPERSIDPTCGGLLERHGIDATAFRSTVCSRSIISDADLVLCFTQELMSDILRDNPAAILRTFLITDFANMCDAEVAQGGPEGRTASERLASVISDAPLLRPTLPDAEEIADPYHQEQSVYVDTYLAIAQAVERIMAAANPAAVANTEPAPDATHAFAGSVTFVDIPSLPDIGAADTADTEDTEDMSSGSGDIAADDPADGGITNEGVVTGDGMADDHPIPDIFGSNEPASTARTQAARSTSPTSPTSWEQPAQPWPAPPIPAPPQPPQSHRDQSQGDAQVSSGPSTPIMPALPPLTVPTITFTPAVQSPTAQPDEPQYSDGRSNDSDEPSAPDADARKRARLW